MRREAVVAGGGGDTRRLRTVLVTVAAAGVLLLPGFTAGPALAAAQPSPGPSDAPAEEEPQLEVPEAVPGEELCTVTDSRLTELSGLAATEDGFIAVNDGQDFDDTRRPVFFLDSGCNVVDEQSFFPGQPRDPEGLELSGDGGTLWIGDVGDNVAAGVGEGAPRDTVALWQVDLTGGDRTPVIHRFVYPDGQPRDAETLLLDGAGTPIIVTRTVEAAELYVPTDLQPNNPAEQAVPLERVGEFDPPDTGTDNQFGVPGRRVITGGAVSPDGSRVVLRTYADAFEFDVADGDVVAAITNSQPRVTPLPGEPQGEAITYSADGAQFLTVSEVPADAEFTPVILSYTPTPPAPEQPPEEAGAPEEAPDDGGFSLVNSVQDIINLIAAVGVLGLLLVTAGVIGIVRARRRSPGGGDRAGDDPDGGGGDGAGQPGSPVTGRARISGEPEAGWEPGPGGPPAQPAGVYTSRATAPGGYAEPGYEPGEYRGSEYHGAAEGGGEPGRDGYGQAGYQGNGYPGAEYGGRGYAGTGYDRSGGYDANGGYGGAEPAGGAQYAGGDYGHGGEHGGGTYGGGGDYGGRPSGAEPGRGGYPDQPYDQAWADGRPPSAYADEPAGAGTYRGERAPRSAQPPPDAYSDDPDYPYEFREPGRW